MVSTLVSFYQFYNPELKVFFLHISVAVLSYLIFNYMIQFTSLYI